MNFSGFQKLTLLDYPEHVACTLFTKGCNFRCPFCHNALLVTETQEKGETYSDESVLSYLTKRVGILDGVCITGGEPLLQKELPDFIRKVKALGYQVKLDTNGSFPDRLASLVNEGLLDYVAMDIKNSMERYGETIAVPDFDTTPIEESIDFLLEGRVAYEFRTTVVAEFHTTQDIVAIAKRIQGAPKYFLQIFVDSGCLIGENLHSVDKNVMENMKNAAAEHLSEVSLRGL
ncbi:MAG: anaerobic ribonucleoside-triphosphate reductase activating protein [Ruminococcaceae bacterium]|nr:anaerobic ribonucleoside-triphosphate reductase activating protein [Oscillospiraceae bacterium]